MEEKVQKLTDSGNVEEVSKEFVVRAFTEFNKWHGPEAVAELVKLEGPSIVVGLSGPFCRTCGLYDYFDDLKLELEKMLGKPLVIAQVDSGGDERYVITYKLGGAYGGQ
ncbi:MAG: hypothetical protein ACE5OT_04500 [Candidatus Hadarchaeaceae archaeon]